MKSIFNNLILYKKSIPALRFYLECCIFCLFFLVFFFTIGLNYLYPFNYLNIAFYVLLSGLVLFWSLKYNHLYFNYYFVFFVFFNVMIVVSSLLNGIFYINTTVLTLCATTFIFSQFIVKKEYRNRILKVFMLAFVMFLFVFTLKNITSVFTMSKPYLFGADPNVYSYIFVYSYLILLYYLVFKRKYILIPFCLYTIFLVFLIGSRSALLLMILCTIIMLFLYFGKHRFYIPIIITVVIILLAVLVLSIPQFSVLKDRLVDAFESIFENGNGDNSSNHRIMMFFYGIELIAKRPLFGYGGIYRFSFYNFAGSISHNNLIEVGFNYGLLTLVIYEGFIIYSIYKLFKNRRAESNLYIVLLIAFFLMQFFYPIYTNKIDYFVVCFAASALVDDSKCVNASINNKKIQLSFEK